MCPGILSSFVNNWCIDFFWFLDKVKPAWKMIREVRWWEKFLSKRILIKQHSCSWRHRLIYKLVIDLFILGKILHWVFFWKISGPKLFFWVSQQNFALSFSYFFAWSCRSINVENWVRHNLDTLFWFFWNGPIMRFLKFYGEWKHDMFLIFGFKLYQHKMALKNFIIVVFWSDLFWLFFEKNLVLGFEGKPISIRHLLKSCFFVF